ncbi:hypothetical protein B0T24DRAFT_319405 [Lasiosphaeria ovina]|uniref:Uncharacterized protein n=1 Tax=Lasiosphaeria ovina TaxID=92902 RepID=A0AAE0K8E0_9PEZI|nr:hypothetical protein B0T24DRAFT_319405 [Lasiosphaeria ovina]
MHARNTRSTYTRICPRVNDRYGTGVCVCVCACGPACGLAATYLVQPRHGMAWYGMSIGYWVLLASHRGAQFRPVGSIRHAQRIFHNLRFPARVSVCLLSAPHIHLSPSCLIAQADLASRLIPASHTHHTLHTHHTTPHHAGLFFQHFPFLSLMNFRKSNNPYR